MPADQTPDPAQHDANSFVGPPPARPKRSEPLEVIGWFLSGALLLTAISAAVYGYAKKEFGEPSQEALQETLHYSVSLSNVDLPLPESIFDDTVDDQLRAVLDEAVEKAAESEEAARIALVTAYELGERPDDTALQTLAASSDEISQALADLYGGDVVTSESVEELQELESREFAVQLAKVHAKEMIGEDGGREKVASGKFAIGRMVAILAIMLGAGLGFAALVLFLVNRSTGRWKPVGFAGKITNADADRYMMRFAIYMATFMIVPGLIVFAMQDRDISQSWKDMIVMGVFTLLTLATLWAPVHGKPDGLPRLVGEKRGAWRLIGIGLFGYVTTVPLLIIVLTALTWLSRYLPAPTHPLGEEMIGVTGIGWLPILMTAAILAPILEETMFRGLLFPAIAARTGRPILAVIVSAFLFAAIHPQGPLIWPALMATGGAAAYLRYFTGSLIPSYTLHIVHNGAIVTLAMFLA